MITYRKAVLEDAQELAKMRGIFLQEIKDLNTDEERFLVETASLEYYKKALKDNSFVSYLALDGQTIVGTSGLTFSLVPPNLKYPDGKVAYIMNMYTVPAYRKQGIAMELFSRIVDEAKNLGYKKITLNATDMGKPVYQKYGFKDVYGDMVYYVE